MSNRLTADIGLAAVDLQLMVRAEEGARDMNVKAVVDGRVESVRSPFGKCVCRTCGKVLPYKVDAKAGLDQMQGGHCVPTRRASVVLLEENVHPQCSGCNKYRSGAGEDFKLYLCTVYGEQVYEEIVRRKNTVSQKWADHELIKIRMEFRARTKRAEDIILNGEPTMATELETKPAELQERQMVFEFDYEECGLGKHEKFLEETAETLLELFEGGRVDEITNRLEIASEFAEAKKKFKGEDSDLNWSSWCVERLGVSRSQADKAIQIHKYLGKKEPEELAGLPSSCLYLICQEGVTPKTRNSILKLAKTHLLTAKDVRKALGRDKPGEETKKVPTVPSSRSEVKAWVEKKVVNSLQKKLNGSPCKDDLPDVLREVADELSAA